MMGDDEEDILQIMGSAVQENTYLVGLATLQSWLECDTQFVSSYSELLKYNGIYIRVGYLAPVTRWGGLLDVVSDRIKELEEKIKKKQKESLDNYYKTSILDEEAFNKLFEEKCYE